MAAIIQGELTKEDRAECDNTRLAQLVQNNSAMPCLALITLLGWICFNIGLDYILGRTWLDYIQCSA